MKASRLLHRAPALAMAVAATVAFSAGAAAQVSPRNPDRAVLPIISGTKVNASNGSCTVGAVLVPRNFISRLTPYQRATRWIVLAKHCAALYETIHMGTAAIGNVVWQSATSDIEMVRVSPQPDSRALYCSSHRSVAFCNPIQTYTPRANNQVFMPRAGREGRIAVTGVANAPDEQYCTSGWASGVRCVWRGMTLAAGIRRPAYGHIAAATSSEIDSLSPGDSGGPVVTYDRRLVGIISSTDNTVRSILFYTPMEQVLNELFSYTLAPSDVPTAANEVNLLTTRDVNAGWELAPPGD